MHNKKIRTQRHDDIQDFRCCLLGRTRIWTLIWLTNLSVPPTPMLHVRSTPAASAIVAKSLKATHSPAEKSRRTLGTGKMHKDMMIHGPFAAVHLVELTDRDR